MKRILLTIISISLSIIVFAQGAVTEENYLKADSSLWSGYNNAVADCFNLMKKCPEKKDSLKTVYNQLYNDVLRQNTELAKKYAATKSGIQRLFMVRANQPKDTLSHILSTLPQDMAESYYGKLLRRHIDTRQLAKGDSLRRFPLIKADGAAFDWNTTSGKYTLLIYGGLDCMGQEGRDDLVRLRKVFPSDILSILVYHNATDTERLRQLSQSYSLPVVSVSDFRLEASPMRIDYGTQATPTCILSAPDGIILHRQEGFSFDSFTPFLKQFCRETSVNR